MRDGIGFNSNFQATVFKKLCNKISLFSMEAK